MDIDGCHVLFYHPWKYDVDAKYSDTSNLYQLDKGGVKYTLAKTHPRLYKRRE